MIGSPAESTPQPGITPCCWDETAEVSTHAVTARLIMIPIQSFRVASINDMGRKSSSVGSPGTFDNGKSHLTDHHEGHFWCLQNVARQECKMRRTDSGLFLSCK